MATDPRDSLVIYIYGTEEWAGATDGWQVSTAGSYTERVKKCKVRVRKPVGYGLPPKDSCELHQVGTVASQTPFLFDGTTSSGLGDSDANI